MSSKGERHDDNQHLIIDPVYQATTREVDPMEEELEAGLLNKRGFEHRGVVAVVISTLIASVFLLSIAFIQVNLNSTAVFKESKFRSSRITYFPGPGQTLNSTWTTNYVLPKDIPLLEIGSDSKSFDFESACPSGKFALVVNGTKNLSRVEAWMQRCGTDVLYFRMNSDTLEESDINRIVNYVKNAQYIPIHADYHGIKNSYELLSNSEFLDGVDKESNIITSLTLSGHVTAGNLKTFVDLIPFVEELTLEGPELCASLVKQLRVNQSACSLSWNELTKLKISFGSDCQKTFEFIDMCWNMPQLKGLEVEGTNLNRVNIRYIEDVIDKYRVMNVRFVHNVCTDEVLETPAASYMCSVFR